MARMRQQYRGYFSPWDRLVSAVPEHASVLDAGCGSGLFLALLAASGRHCRLVGFDASYSAINNARMMQGEMDEFPAELCFHRRDLTSNWPAGEFDVVSLLGVLQNLPQQSWAKIFRKAVDHLAPGGVILYKHVATRFRGNSGELDRIYQWARVFDLHVVHHEHVRGLYSSYEIICFRKPAAAQAKVLAAHA